MSIAIGGDVPGLIEFLSADSDAISSFRFNRKGPVDARDIRRAAAVAEAWGEIARRAERKWYLFKDGNVLGPFPWAKAHEEAGEDPGALVRPDWSVWLPVEAVKRVVAPEGGPAGAQSIQGDLYDRFASSPDGIASLSLGEGEAAVSMGARRAVEVALAWGEAAAEASLRWYLYRDGETTGPMKWSDVPAQADGREDALVRPDWDVWLPIGAVRLAAGKPAAAAAPALSGEKAAPPVVAQPRETPESASFRERLRQEINLWYADGVIDAGTLAVLWGRYEARRFGWVGVVRYLCIAGGLFSLFGVMGMVAALSESEAFAALLSGGLGAALTRWGLRLGGDAANRYATSSKIVTTLGAALGTAAVALLTRIVGMDESAATLSTGLVCLPLGFFLAYRCRNTYLLILTILGLFHWFGAWTAMWGGSAYVFAVEAPKAMCLVALLAVGIGRYHESALYPRTGRFYLAWESLGLLYLDMSLLILSIWEHHPIEDHLGGSAYGWTLAFTAAAIAEIVLGAAWRSALFRGFGITFFAIDVFTRFHELFWARLDLGRFLLSGGAVLMAIGGVTEFVVRARRPNGGAA